MTTQRKPPYLHADGSNCWTKHCSIRGKEISDKAEFFRQMQKTTEVAGVSNKLPPLSAFQKAVEDGRVMCNRHPNQPYITFKYARDTQWKNDWDEVTLNARGIIFNEETGELVARPFSKFFNHNEPSVPREKLHGRVSVTDKLDGSLGIGYVDENGKFNIATSGSFMSEQSKHATRLYHDRYEGKWSPNPNRTYMWEIIYPENRVVVNYDGEDDIHLIGAVDKRTGVSVPLSEITEWKGKRAEEYKNFSSLDAVLAAPERDNKEGFIVHYIDTDTRVKYKHAEYLNLHRHATGVTAKTIWRNMRMGEDMESWKQGLPEEFVGFISERENKIRAAYNAEVAGLEKTHADFVKTLPSGYDRKTFATVLNTSSAVPKEDIPFVMNFEVRGVVTTSNTQSGKLWDRVKPVEEETFWEL